MMSDSSREMPRTRKLGIGLSQEAYSTDKQALSCDTVRTMANQLKGILQTHAQHPGIRAALVGNILEGTVIASIEKPDINTTALAAYATDLLKANTKFQRAFGATQTNYLVSKSDKGRVLLELVPNTDFYVVIVTEPLLGFNESLPCLRSVIGEVTKALQKNLVG
jgi:predicted regulator of Ras-like GTPase activity (Roadblock/LC7/MglB family)